MIESKQQTQEKRTNKIKKHLHKHGFRFERRKYTIIYTCIIYAKSDKIIIN